MNDAIEAGAGADLLPCPFCGGSDLVLDKNGYKTKWVICDGCGATIDDSPHGDCVDLWNTRAIASGALVPASATKPYSSAEFLTSPEALDEYVKEMVAAAVAEMRERCAKAAEGPIYKEIYRGDARCNWFHIKQPGQMNDYGNARLDAAVAIRQLDTAPASGDYVVVPRSDLQVVVDIAARNEAAPEIGRVRAMLNAASSNGGGK